MPNDEPRKPRGPRKARQPHDAGGGGPAGGAADFFLAVYQSGLRGSRIYRVYPRPDGLLFLCAGPMVVFIDVETARRIDPTHWAIKAAGALKTGLVAGAGAALAAGVLVLRIVMRLAWNDLSQAGDLLGSSAWSAPSPSSSSSSPCPRPCAGSR
jgi:hypothetical protein